VWEFVSCGTALVLWGPGFNPHTGGGKEEGKWLSTTDEIISDSYIVFHFPNFLQLTHFTLERGVGVVVLTLVTNLTWTDTSLILVFILHDVNIHDFLQKESFTLWQAAPEATEVLTLFVH
jgi:hypothetical protein